jgi:hypothetical protein
VRAVLEVLPSSKYVLCFIDRDGSPRQGHAVLRFGNAYYDPTLEPQFLVECTNYVYWTKFGEYELKEYMRQDNEIPSSNDRQGVELFPPILFPNGVVRCSDTQTQPGAL